MRTWPAPSDGRPRGRGWWHRWSICPRGHLISIFNVSFFKFLRHLTSHIIIRAAGNEPIDLTESQEGNEPIDLTESQESESTVESIKPQEEGRAKGPVKEEASNGEGKSAAMAKKDKSAALSSTSAAAAVLPSSEPGRGSGRRYQRVAPDLSATSTSAFTSASTSKKPAGQAGLPPSPPAAQKAGAAQGAGGVCASAATAAAAVVPAKKREIHVSVIRSLHRAFLVSKVQIQVLIFGHCLPKASSRPILG